MINNCILLVSLPYCHMLNRVLFINWQLVFKHQNATIISFKVVWLPILQNSNLKIEYKTK